MIPTQTIPAVTPGVPSSSATRRPVPLYAVLAVLAFCAFWIVLGAYALAGRERHFSSGAILGLGLIKFHLFLLWPLALLAFLASLAYMSPWSSSAREATL